MPSPSPRAFSHVLSVSPMLCSERPLVLAPRMLLLGGDSSTRAMDSRMPSPARMMGMLAALAWLRIWLDVPLSVEKEED